MDVVPLLVVIVILVKKLVDFAKYVKAGNLNGILTQLLAWIGGIAAAFLGAQTQWAEATTVGGVKLSDLGWASLVLVGLIIGSAAITLDDTTKAIDTSDSAHVPDLVDEPPHPTQLPA